MARFFTLRSYSFICCVVLFAMWNVAGAVVGSRSAVLNDEGFASTEFVRNNHFLDALPSQGLWGIDLKFMPLSVFHPVGAARQAHKQLIIKQFCDRVDLEFQRLRWAKSPCHELPWQYSRVSELGRPLVFWEYNGLVGSSKVRFRERGGLKKDETTIVLGGVHPDEINPIHLAFKFAEALNSRPDIFADRRVIIAPLVNPDGFFVRPYRRTNTNGVDLNRNFATQDWWASAKVKWKERRKSDPRHFPGFAPATEEGTRFQVDLLDNYDADKVISIHAPLGFLDYDGPGDTKKINLSANEKKARDLANIVSRKSNNYAIKDFVFYPGSLGNFSGNERSIPTVTLELKSTNPAYANKYFYDFYPGLVSAVQYDFQKEKTSMADIGLNTLGEKN